MNAQLSFRKAIGKPPVFTFRRTDGSTTWSKLSVPIEHDLAHYAVEKTLRFRRAFYGLLDEGFTAEAFEAPRASRLAALLPQNLPLEALQTEHIVGRLQTELLCGINPDFISDLKQALDASGLPYPASLTPAQLDSIRGLFGDLVTQWKTLAAGEELHLSFQID